MTRLASTRLLFVGAFLLAASTVLAQSTLLQGGPWMAGHVPAYTGQPFGQTIVIDGGTAGGGDIGTGVSEIGITARGIGAPPYAASGGGPNGETFCSYDAPTTNPTGYHYLCLSPNAEGGGLLSYGAAGTATALPFKINVNGADQAFSFTPSTAPAHQFANALTSAGGLAYAQPAFSDLSGVLGTGQFPASTAPAHQFARAVDANGALAFAQPSFSDLSGVLGPGQFPASTAPAHQFAVSIAVNGLLAFAQPAFSDLSGVLGAGQFPASSGSTHQFATGIDVNGALSFAQPAFSDLSGSAGFSQLPVVGAFQTVANLTTSSGIVAAAPYAPVFNPMSAPYGAKGDGATDDTTAWQAMCSAVQAAGSGSIVSPAGKTYLVYSDQTVLINNAPMCAFSSITAGVSVQMSGSMFQVAHVFAPRGGTAVTGTSAGTGGVCLLQVASNAGYQSGDILNVSAITGSTECNGTKVAVIPPADTTHIGLAGTTWANAWTGSGSIGDTTGTLSLFSFNNSKYVITDGVVFNQVNTEPSSNPVNWFTGVVGIAITGFGGPYRLYNSEGTGGQQPIKCSGLHTDSLGASSRDFQIINVRSTNEIYGVTTTSGCSDLFMRGLYTDSVDRSFFTLGAQNQDVWLTSVNEVGQDVLVATDYNTITVSGAVSGTGSKCQLTVNSTTGYSTGDTVDVEGIVGATACNGDGQTATVNSSTSLTTSNAFGSAYVSGGTVVDTTSLRPTENISINYSVLKRTSGTGAGQLVFYLGNQGQTHGVIRNVRAVVDMDMRGDSNGLEPVEIAKFTTSALSSTLSDITISGTIRGETGAGYAVDLFTATDSPWSGENAKNINVANLRVVGGTQGFYTDFAPFSTTIPGGLTTSNVTCDCAFTSANMTNILTQWTAVSTYFTNLKAPFTTTTLNVNGTTVSSSTTTGALVDAGGAGVAGALFVGGTGNITGALTLGSPLTTANGGTGVASPTAHSLVMAEGASAFALLTAGTAGRVPVDQGSGADFVLRAVSGDFTLSSAGVATAGGNVALLNASQTFTGTPQVVSFSQNNQTYIQVANTNAGNVAAAEFDAFNGTASTRHGVLGTGYATYENLVANAGFWYTQSTAGLALDVDGAGPITLRANGNTVTLASTGVVTFPSSVTLGSALTGVNGGTGLSTAAIGDIMYASATTPTWARLADVATGSVLVSGGVSTAPAWSASPTLTGLTLGTALTGPNGGTGLSIAAIGDIIYASATTPTWARLADVAVGQILASGGTSTAPAWSANAIVTGYAKQTGTSGPTLANGTAAQFASATLGAIYTGQGSTDDWVMQNKTPATVLANPTGTLNMVAAGTLTGLTGLTSSGTITFSGVTTGTNADFACFSAGGVMTLQTTACTISSRRFKQDIVEFHGGLDEVLRLRPVTFVMRAQGQPNPDSNFLKPQIGLIAEDVAEIDRRAAIYEDDGVTPKSYRQEAIIAMLVDAVQAQERRIKDLEHRLVRRH